MADHEHSFQSDFGHNVECIHCGETPEIIIKHYKMTLEKIEQQLENKLITKQWSNEEKIIERLTKEALKGVTNGKEKRKTGSG